jgi:N-acyl-D-amino-acid deacylase
MYDILIRGGRLYDGTGDAGVSGDLAIRDGRIAVIGPQPAETADKIIDASGLAVAPGFIDIKTTRTTRCRSIPKPRAKYGKA